MDERHLLNEELLTGYWDWDMAGGTPFTNAQLLRQLGYADDDSANSFTLEDRVFDEDIKKFKVKLAAHIAGNAQVPFVQEVRFRFPDGKLKYLLFTGRVTAWGNAHQPLQMSGTYIDTSPRKEKHRQFLQMKDFFDKTNEIARVGGWELDLETNEVTWSAVTKKIFGVSPHFVPQRGSAALFFKEGADRDALQKGFLEAVNEGKEYDLELKVVNSQNKEIWTRTMGHPEFENGKCVRLYGIFQDITEHKEHDEQLRMRQEQMEKFIGSAPVSIAMFDREMNYVAASQIWMASYNLDVKSIIGKSHFEVFSEIPNDWKAYLKRCLNGEVIKKEEDSFIRRDGIKEWIRWEIRPWNETAGRVGGVIMFTELITEKKRVQEELIRAKEQAEEAVLTKSRFLSVMSHEIRTPMNAVIGFTNLLLTNPREDQIEYLKPLKFSADNLMVIINDILSLSKIEEGMVNFEETDFNPAELLQNIYLANKQFTAEKNIDYKIITDPAIPLNVIGDPVRLGQIISNLANNAIKFTEAGHVYIKAIIDNQDNDVAVINFAVSDTGIGIPKDKQAYIFEIFTQASSETTRQYGGTGLGLAICKRLVEMMGGQIKLDSTPGQGSTFSFTLKFKKSRVNNRIAVERKEIFKANSLYGTRILITEDNPLNVLLLKKYLHQWGVECDVAENGQVALAKIVKKEYDLILMDLQMPVMDGFETTRKIRGMPGSYYQTIPVIALTASMLDDVKEQIYNSGMNDCLSKPFNYIDLYEKISRVVQQA